MLQPREGDLLKNAFINGTIVDTAIVLWNSESKEWVVCQYYPIITNEPDSGDVDNYNINDSVPFNQAIVKGTFYE